VILTAAEIRTLWCLTYGFPDEGRYAIGRDADGLLKVSAVDDPEDEGHEFTFEPEPEPATANQWSA
jgi:hypothetical protein